MDRLLTALLIAGTIASGGCSKQKTAPPVAANRPTPAIETTVAVESEPEPEPVIEEPAPDPLPPPQRILLLARGGPLIIDVWLTIDGRPHKESLESLVDQVVAAGDADGNGRSTWEAWGENEDFLLGEVANLPAVQKRQINMWVERYDENEDGLLQRHEAAAWLGRDGGRSARAFSVRSSRGYLAMAAGESRLWSILDRDADGELSSDELSRTPQRLFLLDTNDDQIVDKSELATLRDQLEEQTMQQSRRPRSSERPAAIHLSNRAELGTLDYVLSDLYAPRQQLGQGSFSARRKLFDKLDQNKDGYLNGSELTSLLDVDPHLKIAIDFGEQPDSEQVEARLQLLEHTDLFDDVKQPTNQRIVLSTVDTQLTVSAHDLSSALADAQLVQRSQIQMMVHDRGDSLFEALDASRDATLGEREMTLAAKQLQEFDANDDGRIAADELSYSMTVAFLRAESPGEMSFYIPSFLESATANESAPPWFGHADLNGDGDVSRREFLGNATHFARFDADQDGFISREEARSDGK